MSNETDIRQKCVNFAENSHATQPNSISLLEQCSQDPPLFPGLVASMGIEWCGGEATVKTLVGDHKHASAESLQEGKGVGAIITKLFPKVGKESLK